MVSWARSVVLNAGDRGGRCYPPVVLKWGDFVFKRTFGNVSGLFFIIMTWGMEVLLASSGKKPGVMLSVPQCTG